MINLDDATDEQLRRVQKSLRKAAWRLVERMDLPITPRTPCSLKWLAISQLSDYISLTQSARSARLQGQIECALHYEGRRDAIYNLLPARLRW